MTNLIQLQEVVASPADDRDYLYDPIPDFLIRPRADLRKRAGRIANQGAAGSCTAHGVVAGCEIHLASAFDLSRRFLFDMSRQDEGHTAQGLYNLRTALKAANHHGIPTEALYPYDATGAYVDPPQPVKDAASLMKLLRYERIDMGNLWERTRSGVNAVRSALSEGCPVVFAARIGKAIAGISGPLAQQSYPALGTDANLDWGAHAMCFVGYESDYQILENSWFQKDGKPWGDNGYGRFDTAHMSEVFDAYAVCGYGPVDRAAHRWALRHPDLIRKAVDALISNGQYQAVIDLAGHYLLDDWQIERIMGWPDGSVRGYRVGDGAALDWSRFVWGVA
jgi:hypothetical protein